MINKKPLIIWQKWIDPFGDDMAESRWDEYDKEDENIDLEEDSYPPDLKEGLEKTRAYSIKVISSPMGLIPYGEHTASSKIFNFWTGHTNFNLSKTVIDCIEDVDGVETLDIFTRYRLRVGIGKCFNDAETMSHITTTVYKLLDDKNEPL